MAGSDGAAAVLSLRARRISISVEPGFLLISAIIGAATGTAEGVVAWVLAAFVSVLVHELGHAAAFVAMGSDAKIRLYTWGGLTSGRGGLSRWRSVTVSLAGPMVGIVLLGVPAALVQDAVTPAASFADLLVGYLVWASLGWSLLNLLPLVHFDGGNVAKDLLEAALGDRAEVIVPVISMVTAGAAAGVALSLGQPFLAMYALVFVAISYTALDHARTLPARKLLQQAHEAIDAANIAAATAIADRLGFMHVSGDVRRDTAELPAWIAVSRGDSACVDAVLASLPQGVTPSRYLRATTAALADRSVEAVELALEGYKDERTWPPNRKLARVFAERGIIPYLVDALVRADFTDHIEAIPELQLDLHREGLFADAIMVGNVALDAEASPWVAYNLACSAARAGDREAAITALQRAVALGFDDRSLATSDDDLANLRDHERWSAIVSAMDDPPVI